MLSSTLRQREHGLKPKFGSRMVFHLWLEIGLAKIFLSFSAADGWFVKIKFAEIVRGEARAVGKSEVERTGYFEILFPLFKFVALPGEICITSNVTKIEYKKCFRFGKEMWINYLLVSLKGRFKSLNSTPTPWEDRD
jgi:hypothetical protein